MAFDLNDVRHLLAVARTGSTLAASKMLGVNQTTVSRRITALEEALGIILFERSAGGYRLTTIGSELLVPAGKVELAANAMFSTAQELARSAHGQIRFSTSDVLADLIAGPAVASFARAHPHISVVFNADSRAVDLAGDQADVALRAAPSMDEPQLVVRRVMETPWAVYCSAKWAKTRTSPRSVAEAAAYPLASLEGRPAALLGAMIPGSTIRYASNSMRALIEVIKDGECIGALPILVGEQDCGLKRCFLLDVDAGGLWIVFHERLRHAEHVRAFVDHLAAFILEWRRDLASRNQHARSIDIQPLAMVATPIENKPT